MSEEDFKNDIERTEKTSKIVRNIGWSFVGLGFVGLIIGFFYWFYFDGKLNEVGDFVGGISGSLWALAGLFFIYVAFLGQKIEIKYQQEELKLNREELRESKEVFKAQANIMLDQKLDTTFFNLLDNHRKLVESFKKGELEQPRELSGMSNAYNQTVEMVSGYDVLENIHGSLKWYLKEYSNFLKSRNIFSPSILKSNPRKEIKRYRDIEILYNEVSGIIEFVSKKIREENKSFYFNTLFNNLSNQEKFLLTAYNRNCSDNHLEELDFEEYLRYNIKNFFKEGSFLSYKNFFLKEYNPRKEVDEDIRIKIIDKNPYDYCEFNLYLVYKGKEKISHAKKIQLIQEEIPIYNTLLDITKLHFAEKIQERVKNHNNNPRYNIVFEGKNSKYKFNIYSSYDINISLHEGELRLYKEGSTDSFPVWIQDHFNNFENQDS